MVGGRQNDSIPSLLLLLHSQFLLLLNFPLLLLALRLFVPQNDSLHSLVNHPLLARLHLVKL